MGRLKLSEINLEYVKNFLDNHSWSINSIWVTGSAIIDIIILLMATYYFEYQIGLAIVSAFVCFVVLLSVIYFFIKVDKNKKNLSFFMGIYSSLLSVSSVMLSYAILNNSFKRNFFLWFIILFSACAIRSVIVCMKYKRRICKNYYTKDKKFKFILKTVVFYMLIIEHIVIPDTYHYASIIAGLALYSAENVYFFIRSYCYKIVEKEINPCKPIVKE